MARKRYENPLFTAGLFVLMFLGLIATALDPTGLAKSTGAFDLFTIPAVRAVLFAVGLLMIIAGGVIRLVAIVTLKKNFSGALRIREGHTLVTDGIYRRVRHPAYFGAILVFVGIPVMLSSIVGFLVMLLFIPYLLHRIKLEERMLIERFGKEYEDYMRRSKRLIPFLY